MKTFEIIISRKPMPGEITRQNMVELLYSNTFFSRSSYDDITVTIEKHKMKILGEWISTDVIRSKNHLSIYVLVYGVYRDINNFIQFMESSFVNAPITNNYNLESLNQLVIIRGNDFNEGYTLDTLVIEKIDLNDGIDVIKSEQNFEGGASSGVENFLISIGTSILANVIYDYFKSYKPKTRDIIQYKDLNLSSEIKEAIINVHKENPKNIYLKSFEIDQTNDSVIFVFQSNRFCYEIELSKKSEILKIQTEKIIDNSKPMKKKNS